MKVVVDFEDGIALVAAVADELTRRGVVMVKPERVEPYSVAEVAEMAGVSRTTVERLVAGGVLKRVKHLEGRTLLVAESVESWMKGGSDE